MTTYSTRAAISVGVVIAAGALLIIFFPRVFDFPAWIRMNLSGGHPTTSEPIPQHDEATLFATERDRFDRWYENVFALKLSVDSPWYSDSRLLADGCILYWQSDYGTPSRDQLHAQAVNLLQAGLDDPLVLFLCAFNLPDASERIPILRRALEELMQSNYPRVLGFWIAVELAEAQAWLGKTEAAGETDAHALRLLQQALKDGEFPAEDRGVILQSHLLAIWPQGFMERNGEAVSSLLDAQESVDDWVKHLVRGEHYTKLAWRHRGSGWAREVTREGWDNFFHYLALAEEELVRSWELNPRHPRAATRMILVSMGRSSQALEDMRTWFDRAITARFDFLPAYWQLEWGLRPRWHGSHGLMLEFANRCAETERYDTGVPFQYVRIIERIASEMRAPGVFYRRSNIKAGVRTVLGNYVDHATDPHERAYYQSHYAIWGWLTGEEEETIKTLRALDYELNEWALSFWNVDAGDVIAR